MSRAGRVIFLGLLISLLGPRAAFTGQAADSRRELSSWDNLKKLALDAEIRVVLKDAKSFQGKLGAVTDEAVIIRLITGEPSFSRETVLRVSSRTPGHRTRNAILGSFIGGMAAGAIYSATKCRGQGPACGEGNVVVVGPLLVVGFVVGWKIPTGGWREVYHAP